MVGDAAVLVWVLACVQLGRIVDHAVGRIGVAGRDIADAGTGLSGALSDAASRASGLPLIDGSLAAPLQQAGTAATRVTAAGMAQESAVARLAVILGIIAAVLPALVVVAWWVPRRVRWSRAATAAVQLREQDLTLVALRPISRRPLRELQQPGPRLGRSLVTEDRAAVSLLAALEPRELSLAPVSADERVS